MFSFIKNLIDNFNLTFNFNKQLIDKEDNNSTSIHTTNNPSINVTNNHGSIVGGDTYNNVHYNNNLKSFCFEGTTNAKNVTGDGSLFKIQFNKPATLSKSIFENNYTCELSGRYNVTWNLEFEGLNGQEDACIHLITTNKTLRRNYYNLKALSNFKGKFSLQGELDVELDLLDSLSIAISAGNTSNLKTISISESQSSYLLLKLINLT